MTSVADADLLGTEGTGISAGSGDSQDQRGWKNVSKRVGYKGNKRYVTVDAISTGTTSVGCVSVDAMLFNPSVAPTSNP